MDNASGWTAAGTFWVAVVAAAATTITVVLAWRAARSMANVERGRWNRELTPVFTITVEWPNGMDTDWLRFKPDGDNADKLGRAVPGRPLVVGEELAFGLESSMRPGWITVPGPAAWGAGLWRAISQDAAAGDHVPQGGVQALVSAS